MARNITRLGTYLRDRRARLDPAALGFPGGRRRTPGLRREEVAQRANISPTWYTWLEQGRGGECLKRLHHPELGLLELEFSAFAVDGRPDLGLVVYNPSTRALADRIRAHMEAASG